MCVHNSYTHIEDEFFGLLCEGNVKVLSILELIVVHDQNLITWVVLQKKKKVSNKQTNKEKPHTLNKQITTTKQ